MNRFTIIVLGLHVFAACVGIAHAQEVDLEYAVSLSGNGSTVRGADIVAADDGALYSTGFVYEEPHADAGETQSGSGDTNQYRAYVSKLSPIGEVIWMHELGGGVHNYGMGIALDREGNVYHAGLFAGIVDFDSGTGVFELSSGPESGWFVRKLDVDGNFLWARSIEIRQGSELLTEPPPPTTYGAGAAVDFEGNVYSSGLFVGAVDFDPGSGVFSMDGGYGGGVRFIQKLSPVGSLIWAKMSSGPGRVATRSLAADASGNIYSMGHFSEGIDFDPSDGAEIRTSAGDFDIYIQKLDRDGNLLWVRQLGGDASYGEEGIDFAVDCVGGTYTTGYFSGTMDFDPGSGIYEMSSGGKNAIFLQKLDSEGTFEWARSEESEFGAIPTALTTDRIGAVYLAGARSESTDFGPGRDSGSSSGVTGEVFLQKLSPQGTLLWHQALGQLEYYRGAGSFVNSVGGVFLMGQYSDRAVFSSGDESIELHSTAYFDTFTIRLGQAGGIEGPDLCTDSGPVGETSLPNIALTLTRSLEFIDEDDSGTFSIDEAIAVIPSMTNEQFSAIDSDGNDALSQSELAALVPPEEEPTGPIFACPNPTTNSEDGLKKGLVDIFVLGISMVALLGIHRYGLL